MQRIAVIDYGMGNLRSVSKAIEVAADVCDVVVTSDASVIASADRVVCPGQGAALDCMSALSSRNLVSVIKECIAEKPFLGICMGLQVLLEHSEENNGVDCIGLVNGAVKRFASPLIDHQGTRLKVPHMGWNQVLQAGPHPLWTSIEDHSRFYFAHSYYITPADNSLVAARCHYGVDFAVAIELQNVFACQFHPEKSAVAGLQLLKNFSHWNGASDR